MVIILIIGKMIAAWNNQNRQIFLSEWRIQKYKWLEKRTISALGGIFISRKGWFFLIWKSCLLSSKRSFQTIRLEYLMDLMLHNIRTLFLTNCRFHCRSSVNYAQSGVYWQTHVELILCVCFQYIKMRSFLLMRLIFYVQRSNVQVSFTGQCML